MGGGQVLPAPGFGRVREINPTSNDDGHSGPRLFSEMAGKVYFMAKDGVHGEQLWVTDGTPASTRMVKDAVDGGTLPGSGLFVVASGGKAVLAGAQQNLWATDGTSDGTVLLMATKKSDPALGSFPSLTAPTKVGDRVFFFADDGVQGPELYVTDGTAAGTRVINPVLPGSTVLKEVKARAWGNKLVFYTVEDIDPTGLITWVESLWISDGTAAGTQILVSHQTMYAQIGSYVEPVEYQGKLYFEHESAALGGEIWSTDGTPSGTAVLKDLRTGAGSSASPEHLCVMNGKLTFFGYDDTNKVQLWTSDGTSAGTTKVATVEPFPGRIIGFLDTRMFFKGKGTTGGFNLWVTDGTTQGTKSFMGIVPDLGFEAFALQNQKEITVGNHLLFSATDNVSGHTLWTTDGTTAGTMPLMTPPPLGEFRRTNATAGVLNSKAYFTHETSQLKFQLYESDGTVAGTRVVAPSDATNTTNPMGVAGALSQVYALSSPSVFGSLMYFGAQFYSGGVELYRLDPKAL